MKTKKNLISAIEIGPIGSLSSENQDSKKIAFPESPAIEEIHRLHGEIDQAARTSVVQAIRIGELLEQLKKEAGHGNWGAVIKDQLPFSERTAQHYLSLHKNRKMLKSANFADLLLSEAYKLVGNPKREAGPAVASASLHPAASPGLSILPAPEEGGGNGGKDAAGQMDQRDDNFQVATTAARGPMGQSSAAEPDDRPEKQQVIGEIQQGMSRVLRKLTLGPLNRLTAFQASLQTFLASWDASELASSAKEAA